MSFRVFVQAVDTKVGSPTEKLVLLLLASVVNDDGWGYPSIKRLARTCELSERSVIDQLYALEVEGFIKVGRAHRRVNEYQLDLSRLAPMVLPGNGESLGEGRSPKTGPCMNDVHPKAPFRVKDVHPNLQTALTYKAPPTPPEAVVAAWNQEAASSGLSKVSVLTAGRRKKLQTRLGEKFFVENWRASLVLMGASYFCRGGGPTGWKASIDWFITPDAVPKIIEGKYADRASKSPNHKNDGLYENRTDYAALVERRAAKRALGGAVAEVDDGRPSEASAA